MKYLFKSTTTIAKLVATRWWLDSAIVPEALIDGTCLRDAMRIYVQMAEAQGVKITPNAIKNRQPMYVDNADGSSKQIGYVVAGHIEIEGKSVDLDIWIKIDRVEDVKFEEEW